MAGIVVVHVKLLALRVSVAQVPGAGDPLMSPASSILKNFKAFLSVVSHSPSHLAM